MAKVPIIPQVQMQMSDGVSLPAPEVRQFQDTSNQAQQALAQGLGSLGQSLGRAGYAMHTQELAKREEEERQAAAQAREMQKLRDKYDETVALNFLNEFKINQSGLFADLKAKKGLAAVEAFQGFEDAIRKQVMEQGDALQPGAQQHLFAKGASTYVTQLLMDARAHVVSEGVAANVAANETRLKDLGSILSDGIVARIGYGGDLSEQDVASLKGVVAGIADHSKALAEAKGIKDKDGYAKDSVSAAVASALKNSIPTLYDDETGDKERLLVSILDTAVNADLIGATEEAALRKAIDTAVGQVSGGTSGGGRRRGEPPPNQVWRRFLESTPAGYTVPAKIDAFEQHVNDSFARGEMTNERLKDFSELIGSLRKTTNSDYESEASGLTVRFYAAVRKARDEGDTASSAMDIISRNPELVRLAADLDSRGLKDGIALSDIIDRVNKLELPGIKGEDDPATLNNLRVISDEGWAEIRRTTSFDDFRKAMKGKLTEKTIESFQSEFSPKQLTETQAAALDRIVSRAEALLDSEDIEKPDGWTDADILRAVKNAFYAQAQYGEKLTEDQYRAIASSVLSTSLFDGKKYLNVAPKKAATADAFYVTDRDGRAYKVSKIEDEMFGGLVDIINNLRKPYVVIHGGKSEHFKSREAADMYANSVGAKVEVADTSDLPDTSDQRAVLQWSIRNRGVSGVTENDLVRSSEIERLRSIRANYDESEIIRLLKALSSAKNNEVIISKKQAEILRSLTPNADKYIQTTYYHIGESSEQRIATVQNSVLLGSIRDYSEDFFTDEGQIKEGFPK